jgi:hypothetical protein
MRQRPGNFLRMFVLAAALVLAAAALGLGTPAAEAAPTEPTLTLAQLEALLATSPGGVGGYFKTVLKGTDIVRIPVTVQAVVPYANTEGSLILFQCSGPDIERIGGIAQGMSGSPVYVVDRGTDKLVGALSYGDVFTTGYLGLATPVEYMAHMEDTFLPAAATTRLASPVSAGGRTVTSVTVVKSRRAARALHPRAGTAVMAPLATVAIAGLPAKSAAYKGVAARLQALGVDVAPAGVMLTGQTAAASAPLVGGAGLAVLFARGDVLYGAFGTVTWNDGDRVVAFGHPFFGMGDVQAYLTGLDVQGVWSSSMIPYKLASPTALAGTLLQDRGSGIAGRVGQLAQEVPLTSRVTLEPRGSAASSRSFVPSWVFTGFPWGDGTYISAAALSAAGYEATDYATLAGGATTTTTVVVQDAAGHRYTVVRRSTWDDVYDVLGYLSSDAVTMLNTLVADPDGVAPATVVSVDLTGTASAARSSARITGISFPKGLKPGRTAPFQVSLAVYGKSTPLVLEGALDVPAGASSLGTVNVYPAAQGQSGDGEAPAAGDTPDGSETVAERVAAVEALPTNDQLVVAYVPDGSASDAPVKALGARLSEAVTASLDTTLTVPGRYITGRLQRRTGSVTVKVVPATVRYGGACTVHGVIAETAGDTSIDLYVRPVGAAETTKVATVPAPSDGAGGATFAYRLAGLTRSSAVTARWAGDSRALAAADSARVTVRKR